MHIETVLASLIVQLQWYHVTNGKLNENFGKNQDKKSGGPKDMMVPALKSPRGHGPGAPPYSSTPAPPHLTTQPSVAKLAQVSKVNPG